MFKDRGCSELDPEQGFYPEQECKAFSERYRVCRVCTPKSMKNFLRRGSVIGPEIAGTFYNTLNTLNTLNRRKNTEVYRRQSVQGVQGCEKYPEHTSPLGPPPASLCAYIVTRVEPCQNFTRPPDGPEGRNVTQVEPGRATS